MQHIVSFHLSAQGPVDGVEKPGPLNLFTDSFFLFLFFGGG